MWNSYPHCTAAQALGVGRKYLEDDLDAEVLLRYVLKIDRIELYKNPERTLKEQERTAYQEILTRRKMGEPVAYLTGIREFMGLEFSVSPAALIPRPETELLVERVLDNLRPFSGRPHIVDVGTGSGAIAVSLAYYLPNTEVWAVDISPAALELAGQNAAKLAPANQVKFLEGDLLAVLPESMAGKFDWVVANLPYIPSEEIPGLQPEVAKHEPHLALDGGADGLNIYRSLIPQAAHFLKPGGSLIMEIGWNQGRDLVGLLADGEWMCVEIIKDYAGLDRFVLANWRTA